jgi:hypothetical protein
MSIPNPKPFGINVPAPNVIGANGINLGAPSTVRPPATFNGGAYTGPVTNGPAAIVPSIGTSYTGPVDTLYNGPSNGGNRQMGMFWAQESVKASYIFIYDGSIDDGGAMMRTMGEGHFVFNCANLAAPSRELDDNGLTREYVDGKELKHSPLTNVIRTFGSKVNVMYDVYAVNKYLRERSLTEYADCCADDIFKLWVPMGVVKNEAAPVRTRSGQERMGSRMVNLVVGFRVKAFNIWAGDIDIGTRLFFICKKVDASEEEDSSDRYSLGKRAKGMKYWKIFPYADKRYQTPPMRELAYKDEHGETKLGAFVCVGMASEKSTWGFDANAGSQVKGNEVIKQLRERNQRFPPQIEIYVSN